MLAELPEALSEAAGLELGHYREAHVRERIRRAIEREQVTGVGGLARCLRADPGARVRFRRSVAVSVSGLFRDPEQFELLERELLPPFIARGGKIRAWSAGCADGSELYSVAMVLDRAGALERSFLLGSDLLEENLAAARAGIGLGSDSSAAIRRRLRWEQRDLLRDGPAPGRWHVVLCRNVAIYFSHEAKDTLHAQLASSLARGGVLLLGRSERVSNAARFGLEDIGPHAYRRLE